MTKFKATFTRQIITLEIVEREIEASNAHIAAMRANADAAEFNINSPTDTTVGDTHTGDWTRRGSMEALEDA